MYLAEDGWERSQDVDCIRGDAELFIGFSKGCANGICIMFVFLTSWKADFASMRIESRGSLSEDNVDISVI